MTFFQISFIVVFFIKKEHIYFQIFYKKILQKVIKNRFCKRINIKNIFYKNNVQKVLRKMSSVKGFTKNKLLHVPIK